MDDTKLLIFRSGGHEYGVPLEAVSAVIGGIHAEHPTLPLASLSGDCHKARQAAILLHVDGIQLVLLVDKIIKVISQDTIHAPETAVGAFKLYRFPAARRPSGLPRLVQRLIHPPAKRLT